MSIIGSKISLTRCRVELAVPRVSGHLLRLFLMTDRSTVLFSKNFHVLRETTAGESLRYVDFLVPIFDGLKLDGLFLPLTSTLDPIKVLKRSKVSRATRPFSVGAGFTKKLPEEGKRDRPLYGFDLALSRQSMLGISSHHLTSYVGKRSMNAYFLYRCSV